MNFDQLPKALSRVRSRDGLTSIWTHMAREIYSPDTLSNLPPFAEKLGKTLWDVDCTEVIHAITIGDCAFFVAFQIRLEQIENAAIAAGKSFADRAAITHAKYVMEGFREAAEHNLKRFGGEWPPSAPES